MNIKTFDSFFVNKMKARGIPLLRISLGVVFLWFGGLKLFGVSPVEELVERAYPLFTDPSSFLFLGLMEVVIGIGLLFKMALRFTIALLWLQLLGTFLALLLAPSMFFSEGNILVLSTEGEFVVKNLVLFAASIVVGGNEVRRK